ncbi:MAG: hypothetical protein EBT13_18440 [Rhodobacteraceae bacterium]|nr:hypothetical protein [Paracoccaceae bacterium]
MTYQLERAAIEKFLNTSWAGATPIILDGQAGAATADSISLTINPGEVLQGSIGRAANRLDYIGLVQIMVYTDAGKGSAGWRGYVETLTGIFREARITSAGAAITSPSDEFVRFSPAGQHPYVAGVQVDANLTMTTFNAPFIRYGTS